MDPTLILLVVALGAFIVFQVFQGKKRKKETEERQTRFVPGVEIMTNYGLYGTILSIDDETNVATIESMPGTVLKIHRQTILKVADYEVVPEPEDEGIDALESDDTEPADVVEPGTGTADQTRPAAEFGERTAPEAPRTDPPKKTDD